MALSGDYPVNFAQGRRGEVYVFQGHGNKGQAYSPSNDEWRDVGTPAPEEAPEVTAGEDVAYYIARIDIDDDGEGYNLPPLVQIDPNGATPSKEAKAITRINNGRVNVIEVTENGKGYDQSPGITIVNSESSPTVGGGVVYSVALKSGGPAGDHKSGIVYWEIVSTPPSTAFLTENDQWVRLCEDESDPMEQVTEDGFTCWVAEGQGGAGTGAKVRIEQLGLLADDATGKPCCEQSQLSNIISGSGVGVQEFGEDYLSTDEVTVKVAFLAAPTLTNPTPSCENEADLICPMIIKGYALGHPKCPKTAEALAAASVNKSKAIDEITIEEPGTQYLKAPELTLVPWEGAKPESSFTVSTESNSAGEITAIDPSGSLQERTFLFAPEPSEETANVGGAKAYAVMRAHLRGKYQCYYRYVNDSIPESEGGPLYSNLSPLTEVDCGDGTSSIEWSYDNPPEGLSVELWRSTSNQAITLFRVAKIGGTGTFGSTTDDLTDWELVDVSREGFLAMPILLPNGEINANRFSEPPSNYSVGVMFQDRLWMAVDTEGGNANTLRFSEVDEPESMPDVNELILQSNLRSTDYITALIPYAGVMIVAQSRHCHRLTYVAQPLIDASLFMVAYRGCMNQRCWDIFDGRLYAMDDMGVYSMDPNGQIEDLTLGLFDIWVEKIDNSLRQWFTVRADKRLGVLRVCIALKEDGSSKFATRQFVYSFDFKTWWEERYPAELTSATEVRTSNGTLALVYGTSGGNLRLLGNGLTDLAEGSIQSIEILNPGRGYKKPPTITAPVGHGAEFECGLDINGSITGIIIKTPGTQYESDDLIISAPPAGGVQAEASYTAGDGEQPIYWTFKSGCFEYQSDSQDKRGGEQQTRHCSVTYQPTSSECLLNLKAYYNNAKYPRSNVVRRDRGTGFVHSDEIPAAVLDMQATPLQEAEAHGVARALFAGRVLDDMMGSDRHVSVALSGKQDDSGEVAIHTLDIYGVNPKEG